MLAGVSTRRYHRTGEPVGSEIDQSRALAEQVGGQPPVRVSRTHEQLIELMLDGIDLEGRCCKVALGIHTDGVKHPVGALGRLDRERTVATTPL